VVFIIIGSDALGREYDRQVTLVRVDAGLGDSRATSAIESLESSEDACTDIADTIRGHYLGRLHRQKRGRPLSPVIFQEKPSPLDHACSDRV